MRALLFAAAAGVVWWLAGIEAALLLALLVFAVEAVIANVMARNRSQSAEVHIATGRLNKRRLGQPFRAAPGAAEKEPTGRD